MSSRRWFARRAQDDGRDALDRAGLDVAADRAAAARPARIRRSARGPISDTGAHVALGGGDRAAADDGLAGHAAPALDRPGRADDERRALADARAPGAGRGDDGGLAGHRVMPAQRAIEQPLEPRLAPATSSTRSSVRSAMPDRLAAHGDLGGDRAVVARDGAPVAGGDHRAGRRQAGERVGGRGRGRCDLHRVPDGRPAPRARAPPDGRDLPPPPGRYRPPRSPGRGAKSCMQVRGSVRPRKEEEKGARGAAIPAAMGVPPCERMRARGAERPSACKGDGCHAHPHPECPVLTGEQHVPTATTVRDRTPTGGRRRLRAGLLALVLDAARPAASLAACGDDDEGGGGGGSTSGARPSPPRSTSASSRSPTSRRCTSASRRASSRSRT